MLVIVWSYIYTVNIIFIKDCVQGIREEGLPVYRHPETKGNLYIKFEIEFPENGSLTEQSIVVSEYYRNIVLNVLRNAFSMVEIWWEYV